MSPARHRPALLLLGALSLALLAPAAQAQYKWKDSRGQVHVSDRPPPREVPDKDILQRPPSRNGKAQPAAPAAEASAPAASAPARQALDPELEARRKKQEQDSRNQQRADEERQARLRAENCSQARQQIATLDSGQRMVRITPQGERVVIDDNMRAADLQRARAAAEANCR
ncbi:DUF4124 domain-containing protein [Aquabacterium sp. OR-4]|uniref:DUF4124 domain-containing protein n=1 Tax=Aquabacterium sp. OR-4 TaxID=2978127 RepID=UPI0021B42711|nr:DUF4124 domain-containing protein [Aquabacterium sp. OR-4]MDT7835365.1 DUF4124 domain-containing protein [Aquabacterium sp. OR-4]